MKKISIVLIFLSVMTYAKVNLFIDVTGSFYKPADTGYAEIYGDKIFYPEIITGIKVFKDFFLFGGYGFIDIKGNISEAGDSVNATSKQSYIAFGLGYEFMAKNKISLKLSGGAVFVNYEGKAYLSNILLDEESGNKTGYKFDTSILYNFTKNFNISLIVGYFHAQNTNDFYRKLSYGGLKAGIGLGIKL